MSKGISAIIATIMLLMITVALIGVFYVFSSTMVSQTTSSGGAQVSQITSQLSSCMQIRHITGNQVTLENCGKGVIENKSLVVTMNDVKLGASAQTIQEDSSGMINITGLWQIAPGTHNLKISNGAAFALALVEVKPNKDGLVGSWSFNEGSGTVANDASGNGNAGTLKNGTTTCSNNDCPTWSNGKFGKGLQFDGILDNVHPYRTNLLNDTTKNSFTFSAWANPLNNTYVGTHQSAILARSGHHSTLGYYTSSNKFSFNIYNSTSYSVGISSSKAYPNGEWYYIMGAVDNSLKNFYLYVNGDMAASGTYIGPLKEYNSNYFIGVAGQSGFYNYSYKGTIDEVRIWNRALNPDETVAMKQLI